MCKSRLKKTQGWTEQIGARKRIRVERREVAVVFVVVSWSSAAWPSSSETFFGGRDEHF